MYYYEKQGLKSQLTCKETRWRMAELGHKTHSKILIILYS